MLNFVLGDILKTDAEAIVNPVNCVGVMGRGLALEIKNKFPWSFPKYEQTCKRESLEPGNILPVRLDSFIESTPPPPIILHAATKKHWRGKSKLEYIQVCLENLLKITQELNLKRIALPRLGCGLGELNWPQVELLYVELLSDAETEYIVYEFEQ